MQLAPQVQNSFVILKYSLTASITNIHVVVDVKQGDIVVPIPGEEDLVWVAEQDFAKDLISCGAKLSFREKGNVTLTPDLLLQFNELPILKKNEFNHSFTLKLAVASAKRQISAALKELPVDWSPKPTKTRRKKGGVDSDEEHDDNKTVVLTTKVTEQQSSQLASGYYFKNNFRYSFSTLLMIYFFLFSCSQCITAPEKKKKTRRR